jgi:GNAT superfamily N-acetyltransferase
MARIRASEWGEVEYWQTRIGGYLAGSLNPQQALALRHCLVAIADDQVIGFAAGHLTRRYGCAGEIQWINVAREWRGRKVASELVSALAKRFVAHGALRVCVDVEPQTKWRAHSTESLELKN